MGQGSAIAVTAHTFLTDCRNLVGADAVVLSSGRQQGLAYLDPEYYGEDVCVLRSQEIVGKPVHAVRDAGDIRPGEQVYAVADPEGLGPVLQAAALTGTRRDSGIAWLQTTAAVTTRVARGRGVRHTWQPPGRRDPAERHCRAAGRGVHPGFAADPDDPGAGGHRRRINGSSPLPCPNPPPVRPTNRPVR